MELTNLKFDNRNANKHTDKGKRLLKKSLKELGAGRSILLDKDDNIIAGNGVAENAMELKKFKLKVVETDGTELVAVKRKDISINSKQGRELAIADNQTAKEGINFDFDVLNELSSEFEFELGDWEFAEKNAIEDVNIYDSPMQLLPDKEYILIIVEKEDFDDARDFFNCGFVKKNNGAKNTIVKSRTVNYQDYINYVNSNTEQKQTV